MKKLLLSASMLMLAGASAFAVTDGQTYESVDGINCENLWVLDRFHAEEAYMGNPIANKDARTATADGTTVYVGVSGVGGETVATIEKFDLKTGAYLGSLALTKGGEAFIGKLAVNQVGFDEYGHFYVATFNPNSKGDGQYEVYTVDLTTGAVTSVGDLLFDGGLGRVDYCDVIGDITGVEAKATLMAVSCAADNLNVFKWVREKGSDEWMGGWTDQATFQAIKAGDTYPNSITGFGAASVVKMVRDGSKSGEMSMFYIDGFTSLPALYGSDGAMIDNISNADLKVTNKETNETTGTVVAPANGTNGIAEGAVNGTNLMIYSEGQYDDPHKCQAIITTVDENMSFESMKPLWTVPANGLGQISDGGTRYHSLFCLPQNDGSALVLTFKCFNGMGVYKITKKKEDSVESNVVAAANITVNGNVIAVSEVAETIEVFNVAGQKVAEARNASEVAAPATGAYIVKAVVAGAPVVKKVIL